MRVVVACALCIVAATCLPSGPTFGRDCVGDADCQAGERCDAHRCAILPPPDGEGEGDGRAALVEASITAAHGALDDGNGVRVLDAAFAAMPPACGDIDGVRTCVSRGVVR